MLPSRSSSWKGPEYLYSSINICSVTEGVRSFYVLMRHYRPKGPFLTFACIVLYLLPVLDVGGVLGKAVCCSRYIRLHHWFHHLNDGELVMLMVMVIVMVMVKLPSTGRSGRTSCNVEKVLFKKFTSEQINFIVYKSSYAQFLEQIFSAIYWGW